MPIQSDSNASQNVEAETQARLKEIEKCESYIRYFNDQVVVLSRNSLWFNAILLGAIGYALTRLADKPDLPTRAYYSTVAVAILVAAIGIAFNWGSIVTINKLFRLTAAIAKRIIELECGQDTVNARVYAVYNKDAPILGAEHLTLLFYGVIILAWIAFPIVIMLF